jgi:hypothetical protein
MWGKTNHPHRPALSSSVLAALLAVGVVLGFVATRASNHAANGAFSSTTTTAPTTTVPSPTTAPTTTAPPATVPPTTTAPHVVSASSPCTTSDVRLSVSAGGSSSAVTISTAVTDVVPCTFTPQAGGSLSCPVFVDVTDAGGNQVWPGANQPESCSPPSAVAFSPGQQEVVSVVWSQARPGSYTANGFWSWSSGGATPDQGTVNAAFSVG